MPRREKPQGTQFDPTADAPPACFARNSNPKKQIPTPRHLPGFPATPKAATTVHDRQQPAPTTSISPSWCSRHRRVNMSPKLKPLLLPQLVEEKRKLELQQAADGEHTFIYYTHSSSSSDVASPSPATPTFPRSHSRYSGSASSLASSCSDSPASPSQPTLAVTKTSKSQLPDVQEDPLEREEEDNTVVPGFCEVGTGLYDCLCTFV